MSDNKAYNAMYLALKDWVLDSLKCKYPTRTSSQWRECTKGVLKKYIPENMVKDYIYSPHLDANDFRSYIPKGVQHKPRRIITCTIKADTLYYEPNDLRVFENALQSKLTTHPIHYVYYHAVLSVLSEQHQL